MADMAGQLEVAVGRLAVLRHEFEALRCRVAVEEERVVLLSRLVQLEKPTNGTHTMSAAPLSAKSGLTQARLEDAAVGILSESHDAVHIGELRAKLVERGIRIPGKGTDSNIIARLIKEPRIEREKGRRGYYRLKPR
jgi:hypothetical protein